MPTPAHRPAHSPPLTPVRSQPKQAFAAGPAGLWIAWTLVCALGISIAGSALGPGPDPVASFVIVLDTHLRFGWPAIATLLAGIGLGTGLLQLCPATQRGILRPPAPAIGVALLLLCVVLLGTIGLLSTITAWALIAAGLAGLVFSFMRHGHRLRPPPGWLWVGLPGIAVLLVAAANPPGVLWASEYGGYDTLSYHLQLPKEWIASGHTRPVEHNVYSFLPGALEQTYAALGWLSGADPRQGVLGDGAWRLSSAHTLHAGLTLLAAWMIARLSRRLALAAGARHVRTAETVAGGLVLNTPWAIVVGSMAYNEMGVLLLGAGAMLVAVRRTGSPVVRGVAAGALVGVACLVKPTALLFVGAPVGILLLRFGRLSAWPALLGACLAGGTLAISPWLVRNGVMTGNPVFPLATDLLGHAHWTTDQATRFADAHTFDGTLIDRARLLVFADPNAGSAANAVAKYRGTSNTQWLLAFPAGVVACIWLLARRRSRAVGVGLGMCLAAQLIAWLGFTHLQSRFLLPCLIVLGPLVGVACARVRTNARAGTKPRIGMGLGVVLLGLQAMALWTIFAEQRGGEPNALLGAGPGLFLGEPYTPEIGRVLPQAYINHELPAGSMVVMVGGATPLYFDVETNYATVWDTPALLRWLDEGARTATDGEDAVGRGVEFVLIDDAELARQRASGYLNPGLTADLIASASEGWQLLRTWPEIGVRLYRVRTPGTGPALDPTGNQP